MISIAVLDANVLYPAPLRDYLLHLANAELFQPKWTAVIQEEWVRNLLLKRPDLKRADLEKTVGAMDTAFPDANIISYEKITHGLTLPDSNDRHVLAAAIKVSAPLIVTFNLKDFPLGFLKPYNVIAQHPDEFITNLILFDKEKSLQALYTQVKRLKNPPKSIEEVLLTLKKCGLTNSVSLLSSNILHSTHSSPTD